MWPLLNHHLIEDSTEQHRYVGSSHDQWSTGARWRTTAGLFHRLPRHSYPVTARSLPLVTRWPSSASTHQQC